MNRDEVTRVHINNCVRDDELTLADEVHAAAEPGAWKVRNGQVVRHDGTPVTAIGSIALMAYAQSAIPRFVRGVRVLEAALRSAWVAASVAYHELNETRAAHATTAQNAANSRTGPEHELALLIEAVRIGAVYPQWAESAIRQWAGGMSVDHNIAGMVASAHMKIEEAAKVNSQRQSALATEWNRLRQVERDALAHRCEPKPPHKAKVKPVDSCPL